MNTHEHAAHAMNVIVLYSFYPKKTSGLLG